MGYDKEKALINLVADGLTLGSQLIEGLSFSEVGSFIAVVRDGIAMIGALNGLVPEWKSLDANGRQELTDYVAATVKLPQHADVEFYVEKALDLLIAASALVSVFPQKAK